MLVRLGFEDQRDQDFNCGDDDLNEFFFVDSKKASKELVAVTYAYIVESKTKAYFSVANDAIKREILTKSQVKQITLRNIASGKNW